MAIDFTPDAPVIDFQPDISDEDWKRINRQQQIGDVGRENLSLSESQGSLGRMATEAAGDIHRSATEPGGALNLGEWKEAAKNFLPSRIANRIMGNPPDAPFVPESISGPVSYAIKSSLGDLAAEIPGATPGFRKAVEGEGKAVADTALSFVNPDVAVGGAGIEAGGMAAQAIKAAFAAQMLSSAPDAYKKTVNALRRGDESDIADSMSDLAITVGLPIAIVKGAFEKPKQPMDYSGKQIPMPEGARPQDPLAAAALPSAQVLRAIAGTDVPFPKPKPKTESKQNEKVTEDNAVTPSHEISQQQDEAPAAAAPPEVLLRGGEAEGEVKPPLVNVEGAPPSELPKPAETPEHPLTSLGGDLATGGDTGAESAPGTAASNMFAVINKDLEDMGKPPMPDTKTRTWNEDEKTALAEMNRKPDWIPRLIAEVKDKPRPLLSWEQAGMVFHRAKLKAELHNSMREANQAFDDGRTSDLETHKQETARLEDEILELNDAVGRNGTASEAGRSLQAQKMGVKDDLSLIEMRLQKRSDVGNRPLTDAESAELKAQFEKYQKLEKESQEAAASARERESSLEAQLAAERIERESDKPPPHVKVIADKLKTYFDDRAKKALSDLSGMAWDISGALPKLIDLGASKILAGVSEFTGWSAEMISHFPDKAKQLEPYLKKIFDEANKLVNGQMERIVRGAPEGTAEKVKRTLKTAPVEERKADVVGKIQSKIEGGKMDEVSNLAQQLAKLAVEQGARGWRAVTDAVHADLKDLIPNWDYHDTLDAVSGHGKFSLPKKDEVSVALADAKSQANEVRKIQEVVAGEPVKPTGFKRGLPSDAKRRLTQIYESVKRKFGLKVESPEVQLQSALQSRKTYIKNRMADLKYEISRRQRTVKNKTAPPTDPELQAMQAEYKTVKAEHDSIFGDRKLSDEQRVKMALSGIERDMAEYNRRIDAGDFTGVKKGSSVVETPELKAAKARRDALKAHYDELRGLDENYQNEKQQKSLERQRDALEKSIAEKQAKIASGDFEPKKGQVNRPADPTLEPLKQQRDALNKQIDELRSKKSTPEERALKSFMTRTTKRIAELQEKLKSGDFSTTPRTPVKLDAVALKAQAELNRWKEDYQKARMKDQLAKRTKWQKFADTLVKWRQAEVISGPRSLFKLASAAIEGMVILPLRELGGRVLNKLPGLREVAKRAPIEGGHGSFVDIETKAISQTWLHLVDDFGKSVRGKRPDYEMVFGGKEEMPAELQNYVGFLHKAIKSPLKRNVWTRAFETQIAHGIKNRVDVKDPLVQMEYGRRAVEEADHWIFQNPNRLTKAYKAALAVLENRTGGKPTITGKIASTAAKLEFPVVTVPSNLVARVFEGVFGTMTGSARLARAYTKGFENLKPEEADLIMRNFKTGQIGLAFTLMGVFMPNVFGGFYQPGKKRDKSDVPFGSTRIGGVDIPSWLSDNPFLIQSQIGATIVRVGNSKFKKSDEETRGYWYGVYAAITGAAEQQPFVRQAVDLGKSIGSGDPRYFLGEQAKSFADPMFMQNIAEWTDKDSEGNPIIRAPKSISQHVEMGVPGLRKQVPLKVPPKKASK